MDICYVDESGSAELLDPNTPSSTPLFVFAGLIVPAGRLTDLTWDFLAIKKGFNPSLKNALLSEVIRSEEKGADLRADIRSGKKRRVRRAFSLIDAVFDLVNKHSVQLISRVMVKEVGRPIDDKSAYPWCVQWLCRTFHVYLEERDTEGLVVLDSRTKVKNTPTCDAITTQKFRHGGNPYARFAEVPVFGHSDSHIALQVADIIASAVIFPTAADAYCSALTWNLHAHPDYAEIRARYGARLKALQYRYQDGLDRWSGGIYVTGKQKPRSVEMFQAPPSVPQTLTLPLKP